MIRNPLRRQDEMPIEEEYTDNLQESSLQWAYQNLRSNDSYAIQLQVDKFLEMMENNWLARFKNENGEYVRNMNVKPLMNETGAKRLVAYLRQNLDPFTTLSHQEAEKINYF